MAVTIIMMMMNMSTGMIISATGKLDVSSGSGDGATVGISFPVIEELISLTRQLNSIQLLYSQ